MVNDHLRKERESETGGTVQRNWRVGDSKNEGVDMKTQLNVGRTTVNELRGGRRGG